MNRARFFAFLLSLVFWIALPWTVLADNLNLEPVAKAGWTNFSRVGDAVTLNGSGSLDPIGGSLSYLWAEDPGNPETGMITDGNLASITITPITKGSYVFNLQVTNGTGSKTDTVTIHVVDPTDGEEGAAISGILTTWENLKAYYLAEDIDNLMTLYHADFYSGSYDDGPMDKATRRAAFEIDFADNDSSQVDISILSVNLNGPSDQNFVEADVFASLRLHLTDSGGKSFLHNIIIPNKMKLDGDIWTFYGDQQPFWSDAQSSYGIDEWGHRTGVWIGVKADLLDVNQGALDPITSVHLEGPSLPQGGIDLTYNATDKRWDKLMQLPQDASVGWAYNISAYRGGAEPFATRTVRVTNVLQGYPELLYPASPGYPQVPETNVSLQPIFAWNAQNLSDQLYYKIRVSTNRQNSGIIWERNYIQNTGVVYNDDNTGIPLEAGKAYYWQVYALDQGSNQASSDWHMFFTQPAAEGYYPVAYANPTGWGIYTMRFQDNSFFLSFSARAYDPDGTIEPDDIIGYGPGDPNTSPSFGPLMSYDGGYSWRFTKPISDSQNITGVFTIKITDDNELSSQFQENLIFDPLPLSPVNTNPTDESIINTLVPKFEWNKDPSIFRCWLVIVDTTTGERVWNSWIYEAAEFQLPGGILQADRTYHWDLLGVREPEGEISNIAISNQTTFTVTPTPDPDDDGDGIPASLEAILGTSDTDKDSDDDGILDGNEDANKNGVVDGGETNPANPDSDDDEVWDGIEIGLAVAQSPADAPGFRPDEDPATTTDPLYWDSDFDGLPDGVEDDGECVTPAQNGKVDSCETDPMDDDSDDDGLTDGPWGSEDLNANGKVDPGESDAGNSDTDGDGILDGAEAGLTQPEGAGTNLSIFVADADPWTTTDPTDADSDDDGILDGNEDLNGDGFFDPEAGETDASDPDSDGDGILDGTESGLTAPQDPSATDLNIFVADADPSTTTDPTNSDSDGDGISDGEEDLNGDGSYDPGQGETDPTGMGSGTTVCSVLGNGRKASHKDKDIFTFYGNTDETVSIKLEEVVPGSFEGMKVKLELKDKVKKAKLKEKAHNALPQAISATLPADGDYQIIISEKHGKKHGKHGNRFQGDYCLTVESSENAYQTLSPTRWVE